MQICVIMVSGIGIWCFNGLDFDLNASASAHITFVVMFPVLCGLNISFKCVLFVNDINEYEYMIHVDVYDI